MFDMDDEFRAEDSDKNCGFIDNTAQRNNITNSLLNMIDDEPAETSEFDVTGAKGVCSMPRKMEEHASK